MNETYQKGLSIRRQVMGDEFVDRAMAQVDEFGQPLQDFINEHAWGTTWQRQELDRATRSLVTIAMLTALKASVELKGHVRGALRNGCSKEQIREVILHSAVYCGVPAAQEAYRAARQAIEEWDKSPAT